MLTYCNSALDYFSVVYKLSSKTTILWNQYIYNSDTGLYNPPQNISFIKFSTVLYTSNAQTLL